MSRLARLQVLVVALLGGILLRLASLQLARGAHYRRLAEQNRLRVIPEQAPRGLIVDRQGQLLAGNQRCFRVAIVPQELEDLPAVLARVSPVVHRPSDSLEREYRRERTFAFVPATIVSRVPRDIAIRLEEARWRLPGLLVKAETVRRYPLGMSAAHVLGHLGQPTPEELPALKAQGVQPRQLIGRAGIERLLDGELRGRSGGLVVEVDHRGRRVRVMGERALEAGAQVSLTIDARLQTLIEESFGSQSGAGVVLDPRSGEVLAMASVPAFPPEAFAMADTGTVRRSLDDPGAPLLNRATVGVYQPGSIVKLVTAAAALEQRLVTPGTAIPCHGSITIGDRTFHCWNRDGHGTVTLREAITQSCNVYFMQVARRVGAVRLVGALEQAGFGRRSGWPLEEQAGHLPKRRLTEGEVALLGIGQGEILVTALQGAIMASAFANDGWLVEPWVVSAIAGRAAHRPGRRRLGWSAKTLDAVRIGMEAVVGDPLGTGHRAMSQSISVAGKTGTAQTHLPGRTHGWFVGFCPVDRPRAAFAIVAEYGGSGGDLPGAVAKAICEHLALPEPS